MWPPLRLHVHPGAGTLVQGMLVCGSAKPWEVSASQMGEAPSGPSPPTLLILEKPNSFGSPDRGMPRASEPHVSNLQEPPQPPHVAHS